MTKGTLIINGIDYSNGGGGDSGSSITPIIYDYTNDSSHYTSAWTSRNKLILIKVGNIVQVHLEGKVNVSAAKIINIMDNLPSELVPNTYQDLSITAFNSGYTRAFISDHNYLQMYSTQSLSNIEINVHGTYVLNETAYEKTVLSDLKLIETKRVTGPSVTYNAGNDLLDSDEIYSEGLYYISVLNHYERQNNSNQTTLQFVDSSSDFEYISYDSLDQTIGDPLGYSNICCRFMIKIVKGSTKFRIREWIFGYKMAWVEMKVSKFSSTGSGSGGINYSTEEQKTGLKWIDGKDIYQKTICIEKCAARTQVYVDISNLSIDRITEFKGTSKSDGSPTIWNLFNTFRAVTSTGSPGEVIGMWFDGTKLYLNNSSANPMADIYVTIQYTKV